MGLPAIVIQHLRYTQNYASGHYNGVVDHQRIQDISVEMSNLVEQQKTLLNAGKPLTQVEPEEMERYAERCERLRDLYKELTEV